MQFDVYEIAPGRLVMILQADAVDLPTCVVAALIPRNTGPARFSILEPVIKVASEEYVLHTSELAAIPSSLLTGNPVATGRAQEWEIRKALDFLLSGI